MQPKPLVRTVVFFLILTVGCTPGKVTVDELKGYVLDEVNGVRKTVKVGDFSIEVTLRPTDLLVWQEVATDSIAGHKIEALRKKYGSYYYFLLSMSKDDQEVLRPASVGADYSELLNILSFRLGGYTSLTTNRLDTIPLGDSMLTPTYGMSRSTDIILVFNREKAIGAEWVQLNINELGLQFGNQRFRFDQDDLERVPKLDFARHLEPTP